MSLRVSVLQEEILFEYACSQRIQSETRSGLTDRFDCPLKSIKNWRSVLKRSICSWKERSFRASDKLPSKALSNGDVPYISLSEGDANPQAKTLRTSSRSKDLHASKIGDSHGRTSTVLMCISQLPNLGLELCSRINPRLITKVFGKISYVVTRLRLGLVAVEFASMISNRISTVLTAILKSQTLYSDRLRTLDRCRLDLPFSGQ